MANFSVLMSVYVKTKLLHFEQCLDSINAQTLLPSEVIIVKDGHLDFDIDEEVSKYNNLNISIVDNEVNIGLPRSLNKGLQHCNNEIIFRMDTDDICIENRFELQYNKFMSNENLAILGTNVILIDDESKEIFKPRKVPLSDADIRKIMHIKNPFNHPSVVYKKSLVLSVGGYSDLYLYEDWYLWYKLMRLENVEFENMSDILLKYRIRTFSERKGRNVIKAEYSFYQLLYENNFITASVFMFNIVLKFIVRLLPIQLYSFFKHRFDKLN
jgi:glycosyltransferase involved in cell wall biosynthesis